MLSPASSKKLATMRENDKKIFENKILLYEMFDLRKKGWSYIALGRKFNCDHTSIIYQCQKNNIQKIIYPIKKVQKKEIKKNNFPGWTEEQKKEAIRMRTEGIFVRIIAEKIGKTTSRINRFFMKINLPASTSYQQRASMIRTKVIKKEELLWREDDGTTGEKICEGKSYKEYLEDEEVKNSYPHSHRLYGL